MNRWDIVREKRRDLDKMQKDHERKQQYKFWWIRQQKTVTALRMIFDIFNSTKVAIFQEYKRKILTKRIIRRFGQYTDKLGPNLDERLLNTVKFTQTACVPFIKDI